MSLLYSLIQTAKENDMNPYEYLKWMFDQAAEMYPDFDEEKLLPWNCDQEEVTRIAFKDL
jgi:transposase